MNIQKHSYQNIFTLLLALLLVSNYVFGWTIPTQDPPRGNILIEPEPEIKPAGSSGYIQFNDNDDLGADSNLFWDNMNKYLGIGTTIPESILDVEVDSNTRFMVKNLNKSWSGYRRAVILLHEIYNGTNLGENNVVGTIFVSRGSSTSYNRKAVAYIVSGDSYNGERDQASVISIGEKWNLKTCLYEGKKYLALEVPYSAANFMGGVFMGFAKSTGETLLLIDYYRESGDGNPAAILNSEIYNSLADYTKKDTLWFSGNTDSSIPSGMVAIFLSSSCPSGWTKVTQFCRDSGATARSPALASGYYTYGARGTTCPDGTFSWCKKN